MLRLPSRLQNFLKEPGFSGMVTASTASRCSPTSARSATKRRRSKFMLAPEATATRVLSRRLWRLAYSLAPATASAPAGSRMERVSSNTSLMAAQMASLSTTIISSTYSWHRRKVSSPTSFTAAPSAKRPTCSSSSMRLPAASDWVIASASMASTPITFDLRAHPLDVGRHAGQQAAAADAAEHRVDRLWGAGAGSPCRWCPGRRSRRGRRRGGRR
jgi:hypothetical protein